MSDLISRAGLGVDYCNPDVFENKAYAEGWNSLIKIIKEAPTVDAEPARRAVWRQKKMNVPKGKGQTYLMWGLQFVPQPRKETFALLPQLRREDGWRYKG